MAWKPLENQIATSLGDIVARFTIYADPKPVMVEVQVETPVMEHARNEANALLFEDENGNQTTVDTGTPYMTQATDAQGNPMVEVRTVLEQAISPKTGEPALTYADSKLTVKVLDQNGKFMQDIRASNESLSAEVAGLLITALTMFRHEKAAELGIAPSPGAK